MVEILKEQMDFFFTLPAVASNNPFYNLEIWVFEPMSISTSSSNCIKF